MAFRKLAAAALGGLLASFPLVPTAQATGDVWLEGSYEHLNLPNVQFVNEFFFNGGGDGVARQEFVNDDGDFNGFRIDGGIDNIAIVGGAYVMGVHGFFAWHDDKQDLQCDAGVGLPATICAPVPLFDPNPNAINVPGGAPGVTDQFKTERDVNHWGVALDIAQGPMGLKAGPAFRRIDQDTTIIAASFAGPVASNPWRGAYSESLETNYWGAFVGGDGAIDLGGGLSLRADAEAGLYWADTDYSGNYVVTGNTVNPTANISQQLSLESDELAFIGVLKTSLEKDFGAFKLAGFGRVEYISSAPDMAYNDRDVFGVFVITQGSDDETRIGERYAYSLSAGARITVPMGGQ